MPCKNTLAGHLSSNSDGSAVHVCIHQHNSAHSAGTFHFFRIPCTVLKWQQRTFIFFCWSWCRLWTKATSTGALCKDFGLFSVRICLENQWKTEHIVFFALTCLQDAWWLVICKINDFVAHSLYVGSQSWERRHTELRAFQHEKMENHL